MGGQYPCRRINDATEIGIAAVSSRQSTSVVQGKLLGNECDHRGEWSSTKPSSRLPGAPSGTNDRTKSDVQKLNRLNDFASPVPRHFLPCPTRFRNYSDENLMRLCLREAI